MDPWPMKSLNENLLTLLESFDQIFVPTTHKLFRERNSLLIFMFHVVFENEKEMDLNVAAPQQKMTLGNYRQFIEFYLTRGYRFVSPEEILRGLDPSKKHLLLTFDDGYFNNWRLLPLMREYKVPALFFIASNFVKYQKGFWWDILYRERKKQGASEKSIDHENKLLQTRTYPAVEDYLKKAFGEKALSPVSDLDRPFSPQELRAFSREAFVFLGNHTKDHAVLTCYEDQEVRSQIVDAQNDIHEITGQYPLAFSYPNGNYSDSIVQIVKEAGLKLGITCHFGKNFFSAGLDPSQKLRLKRFCFSSGCKIKRQAPLFCSDFSLFVAAKRLKHSLSCAKDNRKNGGRISN